MTVRDLILGAGDNVEGIQVMVRENGGGKWIHGFIISPNARLYPLICRIEYQEKFPWIQKTCKRGNGYNCPVPEGVHLTVYEDFGDYPIEIMAISPKKAPKAVLDLEVKSFLPRNIPSVHGDRLYNNQYELEIDAYAPEKMEKLAVFKQVIEDNDQLEGQMSIEDFLGDGERDNG